ncbi:MAG TPA: DUF2812 domain-containing protein [Patescibacteria group bacterium]|nr:DUF2812 domain-containing protein [Patescibacteria group bacterium]
MSKTVWKLRPHDYWRIGEHESWFADMAAEGLHLKKMGIQFAKFEKGEPEETRYRIDVTIDCLAEEQKSLYKEYGWDFVTTYGKFNVFSSPEALGATELHTEASEQSYTLKALDKNLYQSVVILSLLMVLFLGMMFSVFFLNSTPFLSMVKGQFLQQCLLVVVELYVFYTTIQAFYSIRALKNSLFQGKAIDHHANWRKNRWISNSMGVFLMILAFITIVLPITTIIKSESYTLLEGETNLPIVSLSELENNPDLLRKPGYKNDDIDWSNRLSYDWSPFAPIQYEAEEQGIVTNRMWNDGSGEYAPGIHTQFYKLTFAGMADRLINDLMERFLYRDAEELQIMRHSDFDNLYIVDSSDMKQIFASHDERVLYIRYHGYADINRIIALAAEKLSKE